MSITTFRNAALVAACGSSPLPNVPPPAPAEMRVAYICDNGEDVSVSFFPQ